MILDNICQYCLILGNVEQYLIILDNIWLFFVSFAAFVAIGVQLRWWHGVVRRVSEGPGGGSKSEL